MFRYAVRILFVLISLLVLSEPHAPANPSTPSSPATSKSDDTVTATATGQGIRRIISVKDMFTSDLTILQLANKAAAECSQVLEKAIDLGIKTEDEIFSTLYFPITPLTTPPTFMTFYDDYTDKTITPIEDRYLAKDPRIVFVVLVDKNGYLPSHNTKFSQPRTGDHARDLRSNRTKRIFNDVTGFSAAKNRDSVLFQVYRRDTGEVIADLSVPVVVKSRFWGALRIGFIREE